MDILKVSGLFCTYNGALKRIGAAPTKSWKKTCRWFNNNNNNNYEKFIFSAKCMTSILRHVAMAFPPARQGTILNSHRVIGIPTNTSVVLNCALVTYILMTADVGLPNAVGNVIPRK